MVVQRTGGELIQDFLTTFDIKYVFGNPGTTQTTFLAAASHWRAGVASCGRAPVRPQYATRASRLPASLRTTTSRDMQGMQ